MIDSPAPTAIVLGGGPIGCLWILFLRKLGFNVYLSEPSIKRRETLRLLFPGYFQEFAAGEGDSIDDRFELLVTATSNPAAVTERWIKSVKSGGTFYLFAGIDKGKKDSVMSPSGLTDLATLHYSGQYAIERERDNEMRYRIIMGQSGASTSAYDLATKISIDLLSDVRKLITGRIDGFDSPALNVWPPELSQSTAQYRVAGTPIVNRVMARDKRWKDREKHLKVSILCPKAIGTLERIIAKPETAPAETGALLSELGRTKTIDNSGEEKGGWWSLHTSATSITLVRESAPPRVEEKSQVLTAILAVNPCEADFRSIRGTRRGGSSPHRQALHDGLGLVLDTKTENGSSKFKAGDVVYFKPHIFSPELKKRIAYREGALHRIEGSFHMGMQVSGPGGELFLTREEYCQLVPRTDLTRLMETHKGENGTESTIQACAVFAETEHIACVLTAIQLIERWNKSVAGISDKDPKEPLVLPYINDWQAKIGVR